MRDSVGNLAADAQDVLVSDLDTALHGQHGKGAHHSHHGLTMGSVLGHNMLHW